MGDHFVDVVEGPRFEHWGVVDVAELEDAEDLFEYERAGLVYAEAFDCVYYL